MGDSRDGHQRVQGKWIAWLCRQDIRRRINQSINPLARKTFDTTGRPQEGAEHCTARDIVSTKVGVRDQGFLGLFVVFKGEIHNRRYRIFDITGRTQTRADDPIVRIIKPFLERMSQQGIVLGFYFFNNGRFELDSVEYGKISITNDPATFIL
jgi:hypothetical protein